MYKNATKCNETIGKWCKTKHGASKIIDTFETYHAAIIRSGSPESDDNNKYNAFTKVTTSRDAVIVRHDQCQDSVFTSCHITRSCRRLDHHCRDSVWDPKIPHTRPHPTSNLQQKEADAAMPGAATSAPLWHGRSN
jgi:hypothetical protein